MIGAGVFPTHKKARSYLSRTLLLGHLPDLCLTTSFGPSGSQSAGRDLDERQQPLGVVGQHLH